jgi:hypothetical protein
MESYRTVAIQPEPFGPICPLWMHVSETRWDRFVHCGYLTPLCPDVVAYFRATLKPIFWEIGWCFRYPPSTIDEGLRHDHQRSNRADRHSSCQKENSFLSVQAGKIEFFAPRCACTDDPTSGGSRPHSECDDGRLLRTAGIHRWAHHHGERTSVLRQSRIGRRTRNLHGRACRGLEADRRRGSRQER